jgi:O-acetylhomoserine/O-acetylserine sulfhydrylase-like pyridoxal-dependent enzyme
VELTSRLVGLESYSKKELASKYLKNGSGGIILLSLKDGKTPTESALKSLRVITQSDR